MSTLKPAKPLILWNGRGYRCRKTGDPLWKDRRDYPHAFVAATSRADARRVIQEYCGSLPSDVELRDYWTKGAWGDSMKGIPPERGLWLQFGNEPPVRVI